MKGRSFGVARILIDANLKESIDGHVEFVLDGHLCVLGVREVLVCPSAPCLLASSMEAAVMAGFPSFGGGDELRKKYNQSHVRKLERQS